MVVLQHEIMVDLKAFALAMRDSGKTCSREAYRLWPLAKFTERKVREVFGGWSTALQACGMDPHHPVRKKKLTGAELNVKLFGRDIIEVIKEQHAIQKNPTRPTMPNDVVVIAGDIHFPFSSPVALTAFYALVEDLKPTIVAQCGDLYDMYSQSKFPASMNIYTPAAEMSLARSMAESFWATVKRIVPKASCIQILGNHSARPFKRLMESWPQGEHLVDLRKWFEFDGVKTYHDQREEVPIGDALLIHGYKSKLGEHRDHLLRSVICGHSHLGGVSYRSIRLPGDNRETVLWELNCGYMADPQSKALSYTPGKITRWTHGVGVVDKWGPRFVAF